MKSVKSFNPCISVIQTIYDIIKAQGGSISVISNYNEPGTTTVNTFNSPKGGPPGGELKVETATAKEDEGLPGVASAKTGSEFIIQLPMYQT